jgi:hypothetical protein
MRTRIIHHQDTLENVALYQRNVHGMEMRKPAAQQRLPQKKELPKKNVTHTSSVRTVTSVVPKTRRFHE